jgi:hypothetical protein
MITCKFLLAFTIAFFVFSESKAQASKMHIKDFKARIVIDSFKVAGQSGNIKKKVIHILKVKGIQSAFWDESSQTMIVQFNKDLIQVSSIKSMVTDDKNSTITIF